MSSSSRRLTGQARRSECASLPGPSRRVGREKVAVPTTHLAHLADHVTFPEAATLPIAGMTALRALRLGGDLAGKRVLVTGAAGGVGRFAVELAAGAGATVTGVVADGARAIGLEEIGASAITYELDDLEGPFDFILDAAGGPSFEAAIRLDRAWRRHRRLREFVRHSGTDLVQRLPRPRPGSNHCLLHLREWRSADLRGGPPDTGRHGGRAVIFIPRSGSKCRGRTPTPRSRRWPTGR